MSLARVPVLTREESRRLDAALIAAGVPSLVLMENAGRGAAERIIALARAAGVNRATVLAGPGNNGGDAYVVARHLRCAGLAVELYSLIAPDALRGDAASMHAAWHAVGGDVGVPVSSDVERSIADAAMIVDGLFGTGLSRPLDAHARDWVIRANAKARPLSIALDVPSGLDVDKGSGLGGSDGVFRATNTFTFGAGKPGLYTGLGVEVSGMVETVHLGAQLPVVIGSGTTHLVTAATLSARPHDVHKGDNGRVVIVGGSAGMTGAAVLAARAAHRAGAGLVQIATRAPERIDPKIVEATSIALAAAPADAAREVGELLAKADAAVVGPGLGRDDWGRAVLEAACASAKRLVLDADALTLLAAHGNPSGEAARVLTPHPLEMARLLGHSDADAINVDRLAAARACASKFAATVVLKGAGTVVATREGACWILPFAEAALAVGGSGDVLSGALGARLAERRPGAELLDATLEATVAHARAGSIARRARGGASRGLLAHEIADALSAALEGAD